MGEAPRTKVCVKCGVEKSIDEFGVLTSSEDGHSRTCRECKRAQDHFYRTKGKKGKIPDHKPRPDKLKIPEAVKEKMIAQHEEPAEAQLIAAFKKTTIKAFVKDELMRIIERGLEEKFK